MRTVHWALQSLVVGILLLSGFAAAADKKIPGTDLPSLTTDSPTIKDAPTAEAGSTLECGDKSYKLTTGTDSGTCEKIQVEGVPLTMICEDSEGNRAHADCLMGCVKTDGAADCDKQ